MFCNHLVMAGDRTLRRTGGPPGRRVSPCKSLGYSVRMADARRKAIGKRLQRARRAAGFRSQLAFAARVGVSESSIAQVESGSDRPGPGMFTAIEVALGLPEDIFVRYLETGDDDLLRLVVYPPPPAAEPERAEASTGATPEPEAEGFTDEDAAIMAAIRQVLDARGRRPTPKLTRMLLEDWAPDLARGDEPNTPQEGSR
jgi:transcriptional regulator with XRE-family HTH domain